MKNMQFYKEEHNKYLANRRKTNQCTTGITGFHNIKTITLLNENMTSNNHRTLKHSTDVANCTFVYGNNKQISYCKEGQCRQTDCYKDILECNSDAMNAKQWSVIFLWLPGATRVFLICSYNGISLLLYSQCYTLPNMVHQSQAFQSVPAWQPTVSVYSDYVLHSGTHNEAYLS